MKRSGSQTRLYRILSNWETFAGSSDSTSQPGSQIVQSCSILELHGTSCQISLILQYWLWSVSMVPYQSSLHTSRIVVNHSGIKPMVDAYAYIYIYACNVLSPLPDGYEYVARQTWQTKSHHQWYFKCSRRSPLFCNGELQWSISPPSDFINGDLTCRLHLQGLPRDALCEGLPQMWCDGTSCATYIVLLWSTIWIDVIIYTYVLLRLCCGVEKDKSDVQNLLKYFDMSLHFDCIAFTDFAEKASR